MIVSPLVCGTLGQRVAWHWGFGAAGIGMLLGLGMYLSGRRWLPKESARKTVEASRLSRRDVKTILVLVSLLPALALSSLGNQQVFNAYIVWGEAHYNLTAFGRAIPVTWLVSMDAFVGIASLGGVVGFWRLWSRRWKEPDEIVKITIRTGIFALAPLILALASVHEQSSGQKVSLLWGLSFHIINNIGFAMVCPVGLALFSRAAPTGATGLMTGFYYVNFFIANMIVGRIGALLESMSAVSFWTLHACLVGFGGMVLLVYAVFFRGLLAP